MTVQPKRAEQKKNNQRKEKQKSLSLRSGESNTLLSEQQPNIGREMARRRARGREEEQCQTSVDMEQRAGRQARDWR